MIRSVVSLLLCAAVMASMLLGGCTRKVDPELVYGRESSSASSSVMGGSSSSSSNSPGNRSAAVLPCGSRIAKMLA